MSSFTPLQFMKSAWNPLVWTAVDNESDSRTNMILYFGAVGTLPTDTSQYAINCILMHRADKQLYSNTGTDDTPVWTAFGPGSALPNPLVPGTFLFTDGVSVYWSPALVGQVQYNGSNLPQRGILNFKTLLVATDDNPNSRINVELDVVGLAGDTDFIDALVANDYFTNLLANDQDFIDFLIANNYFTTNLAHDTNFITELTSDTNFISSVISFLLNSVTFLTNLANNSTFISALTNNATFQTNVNNFVSGGGGGGGWIIDQTPDNGTYGLLAGAVDGVNTTFTVSNGSYETGKLLVFLNGIAQLQGAADDWEETTPGSGTFDFIVAPSIGDIVTVAYQDPTTTTNQTGIQFEDEGVSLGSAGTVDELDFVGSGVTASRTGNKVTVNVPGGGGSGSSIVLTAGETINGATDPVPVFVGTNLNVQVLGTMFTDDNWSSNGYDNFEPAVNTSGSPYTWNQNTKYAYKLTAGRVYDVFNFRDIRRQGVNNNDANFTINFYNAGVAEPTGAPIATQSVNFVFPGSGTGSYNLYIELGGEVDCTPVLGGGNNYWVELEIGTIIPGDSSDIETFSRHVAGGGNFLVWNGSAWVAGNVPAVQVIGIPNGDLVYRTYGSGGYVDIEPLSGINYDISRGHFLGWVNQDVVKGDPVTVITDGLVTFTTPIVASAETHYVVPESPASIGGYESLEQDGTIPDTTTPTIGLMLTTTKIKINRNAIKTDQTFYQ